MHGGANVETIPARTAVCGTEYRPDAFSEEIHQRDLLIRTNVGTGTAAQTKSPVNHVGKFGNPFHASGIRFRPKL